MSARKTVSGITSTLLVLCLAGAPAARGSAAAAARSTVPAAPPNLVLITLDTTRADHLGCYGDRRAATPTLDALAARGTLAEQAFAVAPMTLPSHASILTGRYPFSHGVRDNSDFRLPESETTIAEVLSGRGYSTAAVVASVVLAGSLGMAQGFERYDEPEAPPISPVGSGRRVLFSPIADRTATQVTSTALQILASWSPGVRILTKRSGGIVLVPREEQSKSGGDATRPQARAAASADGSTPSGESSTVSGNRAARPFFLWIHYYDPHYEYDPPAPWRERFAGRAYDGEIAYMDAEIERLLSGLRAIGALDRTLIAVTADHGESLGDHGEETHGLFVYDATIRVPMILSFPGRVAAGRRLADPVSSVDLAPTLLELLSVPGLPSTDGRSFAKLVAADGTSADAGPASLWRQGTGLVYSEALSAERAYGWSPLHALRSATREFIEAPTPELYDRTSDRGETRNLAPDRGDEVASLRSSLEGLRRRASPGASRSPGLSGNPPSVAGATSGSTASPDPAAHPDDEERREQLASLGYVGSGGPGLARRTGADPKTLVAVHNAVLRARWLVSKGRIDESRALIDRVLKDDPGNPAILALSGMLLFSRGERNTGLPMLEEAARAAPGVHENQWNLANAYHLAGRLADAARAYRAALAIQPQNGVDHFGLANVLFAMEDSAAAVREYREAIRTGYDQPSVRAALGIALAAAGDVTTAEKTLEEAVRRDPMLVEAWDHLGRIAEGRGRRDLARSRFDRAKSIAPRDPDILLDHGMIRVGSEDRVPANERSEAEADLEQLRTIAPGDPRTLLLDGLLRAAKGDRSGARTALESSRDHPRADRRLRELAERALTRLPPS